MSGVIPETVKMADNSGSVCMEQRVVMKFLVNECVKPAEIYRRLQTQYGDERLSRSKIFNSVNFSKIAVRPSVAIPALVFPSPQQSFL